MIWSMENLIMVEGWLFGVDVVGVIFIGPMNHMLIYFENFHNGDTQGTCFEIFRYNFL